MAWASAPTSVKPQSAESITAVDAEFMAMPRREGAVRGTGAHDGPPGAALVGERERARERRPGLQGDDIPSDGGVQGRLEIAAGKYRQRPARRGDVGRIENDAWTLRKHGSVRRGQESGSRKHRDRDDQQRG